LFKSGPRTSVCVNYDYIVYVYKRTKGAYRVRDLCRRDSTPTAVCREE